MFLYLRASGLLRDKELLSVAWRMHRSEMGLFTHANILYLHQELQKSALSCQPEGEGSPSHQPHSAAAAAAAAAAAVPQSPGE